LLWSGCATGLTGDAFNTSGTKTRVNGDVISNAGGDVEYWFQYGKTTAYGSETEHATASGTQVNQPEGVSGQLTGLDRETTYHFRLCARDSSQQGGPGCGEDRQFTTPNLECGDTIVRDFALSAEVFCESFGTPGLRVGANGIDINLNGHTLRGPLMIFLDSSQPTAIDNSAGHDDVTIRNGTLTSWGKAIVIDGASFNAIRNVSAVGNTGGVSIRGGEGNLIRLVGMTGSRFGSGLSVGNSDAFVVADSSGVKWGISGNGNRVVRNEIGDGGQFSVCLSISGSGNRIADNVIGGCPGGGLVLQAGADNVFFNNEVSGAWSDPVTGPDPDGIRIEPFTANTLLEANFAHDNDDDGIDVRGTGTKLKDNRADDNGDFGIDAVSGVTDQGGNSASGNGNALQCRNVACP
jgi:parallel beta-helix repeat protein